jgi:hypothetical protein
MKCLFIAAASTFVLSCASVAHADNFDFSFQSGRFNSIPFDGVIYGLTDNATSAPTAIFITPNYALYEKETSSPIPSYLNLPPYTFTPSEGDYLGSFTEVAGEVIDGSFSADGGGNSISLTLPDALNDYLNEAEYNGLRYNSAFAVYDGGYPLVITPDVSAAPEPGVWALMCAGVALIGGILRIAYARRLENNAAVIATA